MMCAPNHLGQSSVALKSGRDDRLDFLRGLCLIDMILVHLAYSGLQMGVFTRPIAEYTRFAAGGFVFVAGLCIGAIFLPRFSRVDGRAKIWSTLWRRSAYILGVHYVASAGLIALYSRLGYQPIEGGVTSTLIDLLLWRRGGDLLPLYVVMIAISPVVLEMIHRRLAWLVLACSVALFAIGLSHPWLLSTFEDAQFPILLWQLIYIGGVLMGASLHRIDSISRRWRIAIAGTAWLACAFLVYLAFGAEFGLPVPHVALDFHKVPLSIGEMLRYVTMILAITMTTMLAWQRVGQSPVARFVTTLGRNSLWLYVAHLYLQELVMASAWTLPSLGDWQISLAIAAIGFIWLLALAIEAAGKSLKRFSIQPAIQGWRAVPIGVAMAALLLSIGNTTPRIAPLASALVEELNEGADDSNETVSPDDNGVDPDIARRLFG